jgi:hypothetical protein
LDDSKACSSATNDAVTSSASKRKLEESMKSFLENSSATVQNHLLLNHLLIAAKTTKTTKNVLSF